MHGAIHQPHERAKHEERDGDGGLDREVGTTGTNEESPICQDDPEKLDYLHRYDMESAYLAPRADHTDIQKTFVHDDTHHLERSGWGADDESTKKVATNRLDKCVGKPERHPDA
jgi:hypothetical protein